MGCSGKQFWRAARGEEPGDTPGDTTAAARPRPSLGIDADEGAFQLRMGGIRALRALR